MNEKKVERMNIDDLIRDLIVEDQFKAKYTKRQRTVFCNNMYNKVANFIEDHEKETLEKLDMHHEANEYMKRKMMEYYLLYIIYKAMVLAIILCIYLNYLYPNQDQIVLKQ
jgi:hypothetical protein